MPPLVFALALALALACPVRWRCWRRRCDAGRREDIDQPRPLPLSVADETLRARLAAKLRRAASRGQLAWEGWQDVTLTAAQGSWSART